MRLWFVQDVPIAGRWQSDLTGVRGLVPFLVYLLQLHSNESFGAGERPKLSDHAEQTVTMQQERDGVVR